MKLRLKHCAWILPAFFATVAVFEYYRQIPTFHFDRELQRPAPLDPAQPLKFLVLGDTGANQQQQKVVAEFMEHHCKKHSHIDGIFFLGDNFDNDGITSIDDPQVRQTFEDVYYGPCLRQLEIFASLGNHDYRGSPEAEIRLSQGKYEKRWSMAGRFFNVEFGDRLHLMVLDTNFPDRCGLAGCSLDWLAARAQQSHATWKISIGHHPLRSGGKYPRLKPFARLTLPSFYCRTDTDLYFSGHDHNFQHLRGNDDDIPCPLNQFTIGTGGAPLVPVQAIPNLTSFVLKSHGFGLLHVYEKKLRVELYPLKAEESVYTYELQR